MSDEKYLWSPKEEVPWSRVVAAVPDEAAALQVLLSLSRMSLDEFCRWRDGDFELDEESDDPRIDERLDAVWHHLAHHFERVTGLSLYTFCRDRGESRELETGFEVVGAWQRSPAGKRFFGIKDEDEA